MTPLQIVRIANVQAAADRCRWLVQDLWSESAVGFVGGSPKTGKTWLSLDIALAVAAGVPALGRFHVERPGPVLLYAAEDAPADIRERVAGLADHHGIELERVPLGLIAEPALRLDLDQDRERLAEALGRVKPRLLVLDPLVRLHRGDENSSADVSELLGFLRQMQRRYTTAILVVHHVRKGSGSEGGHALRGSGDLHAWGDSNLYLSREKGRTLLTAEQRARPSVQPIVVTLRGDPPRLLAGDTFPTDPEAQVAIRILHALRQLPLSRSDLRACLRVRNETLGRSLQRLHQEGHLRQTSAGLIALAVPAPGAGTGSDHRQT